MLKRMKKRLESFFKCDRRCFYDYEEAREFELQRHDRAIYLAMINGMVR